MAFNSERIIKSARKARACDGCGAMIKVGSPAVRWTGTTDGDFGAAFYHPDCRAAEVEMNTGALGWSYGGDWWGLQDISSDDKPWLITAYPAVAARLGIPGAQPFTGPYEAVFPQGER